LEESVKYLEQGADIVYHDLYLATKTTQKLYWKKNHSRNLISPVFNDLLENGAVLNNSGL